jgi:hypothetical protein
MDKEKRNHSIISDYGSNDYYLFFKKNNQESKVSRKDYGTIIKEFNTHLRDGLSNKGIDMVMPSRLGRVELRKVKTSVSVDSEGNIVNNLPTNWKATRELWKSNEAAKEKNVKIRFTNEHTDGYTFKISYLKSGANYKNKTMYKLKFNRLLKRNLSKSIFQGNIDAFINPN